MKGVLRDSQVWEAYQSYVSSMGRTGVIEEESFYPTALHQRFEVMSFLDLA